MNVSPPREDIPRIGVDTIQDWMRIKSSYTAAALSAFETRVAGIDPARVNALKRQLTKLIDQTFEVSKPNLRINGKNLEDITEDELAGIQPFDEALDRHIWSLSDQSLNLDGEISKNRREDPERIAKMMQEMLEKQRAVDQLEAEVLAQDEDEMVVDQEDDPAELKTTGNAENVMRKVYAIAEELRQSVASQQERTERLTTVEAEIKALKP
ncbi:hypothetical protein K474DRAFT_1644545 [Panus rudis PR-1116 ss-1]|nr:hypothetical protein K474DRAFT_1644545 [Panus rudis PR-1116 ss-1]